MISEHEGTRKIGMWDTVDVNGTLNVNGNLKVNSCSDDVNEVVSNYPIYTYRPNSESENNAMIIRRYLQLIVEK